MPYGTPALLTSSPAAGATGTSIATGSVLPSDNDTLLVCVGALRVAGEPSDPTVSGTNKVDLTYTPVDSHYLNAAVDHKLWVYRAEVGSGGSAGVITASWGAESQDGRTIFVVRVPQSGNYAAVVTGSIASTDTSSNTPSVTLGATPTETVLGFILSAPNEAMTISAGTDFTKITGAELTDLVYSDAEYDEGPADTTVDWTTNVGADKLLIAFELEDGDSVGGTAYTLSAESASYSVTGTDAELSAGMMMAAEAGAYAVTGTEANLEAGRVLVAEATSFAWTGTDANLLYGASYDLVAEAGAYTWTGADAALSPGFAVAAEAGSFAWTGTDAVLSAGMMLSAESGTFAFTGSEVTWQIVRYGAPGSFVITGSDATLTYGVSYTLTAEAAAFTVTGAEASLEKATVVAAEGAAFTVAGTDATLDVARALDVEAGSFTVTGTDATLTYTQPNVYTLAAEAGSYAWTGTDATLTYTSPDSFTLVAEAGTVQILEGPFDQFTPDSDTTSYNSDNREAVAMAFDSGPGPGEIVKLAFRVRRVGNPTGTIRGQVFATAEDPGPFYRPTGSALASGDTVNVATLSDTWQWIVLTIAGHTPTPNTYIAAVLDLDSVTSDASNYVECVADTTPARLGNGAIKTAGSWNSLVAEMSFRVYYDTGAGSLTYAPGLVAAAGAFDVTGMDATLAAMLLLTAAGGSYDVTGADATLSYSSELSVAPANALGPDLNHRHLGPD